MKSYSPTSPSRRHLTNVSYDGVSKVAPMKSHMKRLKTHAGRNSQGRITMRHQGGGMKKLYRMIDFVQRKEGTSKIEAIEYDPYRTAFIARLLDQDGSRRYVLAAQSMKVGDRITCGKEAAIKPGNRMELKNIPIGYQVYNVELQPGRGGQLARSAGSYLEVLGNADGMTDLKMASSEVRRVSWDCFASIGQVSNSEHSLVVLGKAGRSRWLGIRPTVRGTAMNPVDHPYGGGEGVQPRGTRKPKTLWGKVTGGRKTRNPRKKSSAMILRRRVKKNRK